jgi:hypothetical protein
MAAAAGTVRTQRINLPTQVNVARIYIYRLTFQSNTTRAVQRIKTHSYCVWINIPNNELNICDSFRAICLPLCIYLLENKTGLGLRS